MYSYIFGLDDGTTQMSFEWFIRNKYAYAKNPTNCLYLNLQKSTFQNESEKTLYTDPKCSRRSYIVGCQLRLPTKSKKKVSKSF